ncbi:acetylornithine deacetylase [Bacillus sp. SG-1]|uniref:acetylornithine deacetylase n=1 Tax=Bacillus sp. SG-1 TaxID=161544 RepID=UPI000154381D|nr:acetylornithine deacetylase [Bacillus sp. SG-1]EDL65277.1 acetylornithine deacetylase [Bacillus sp. SG-1]
MEKSIQSIIHDVEKRRDQLVDLLETLIWFETPSPPARNTRDAQGFIASYLEERGFTIDKWDVYPGDPNVVGVKKGTSPEQHKSLIINGHIDVAEIDETESWTTGPFQPEVKHGYVIGRGAADMKGGLAGALFAIGLLTEAGIELPGDLIFQSVIGEEVGEAGTLQCCERGYNADFAVVVDTSDLHIQGQGGVITGWITVKSPTTHHDATRRSMIHAGGGLNGASAIEKMMKIIQGLQDLERHWAVTKRHRGFPPGSNTINPAFIEGGRHPAFIADECKLWITVHFYPDETYEDVAKEVENHILEVSKADIWLRENPPAFRWGGTSMIEDKGEIFPSLEVDPGHPGVETLSNSHSTLFMEDAVIDVSPTVTDGGWLGAAGIPTVIYGPGDLNNAHSVNEKVSINQLVNFTRVMVRFIYDWSATKKEEE